MNYRLPEPLERRHDLSEFVCRSTEQTEWLERHARQSMASGSTRVFVVTPTDSNEVVAYYAWTMGQLKVEDAPARFPQPIALLARLGVHTGHEGNGLGAGLLRDVIRRVAAISDEIGCRGLLVHAESERACGFYRHQVPAFERSPTDELHLVLLLKDIKQAQQTGR